MSRNHIATHVSLKEQMINIAPWEAGSEMVTIIVWLVYHRKINIMFPIEISVSDIMNMFHSNDNSTYNYAWLHCWAVQKMCNIIKPYKYGNTCMCKQGNI